MGPMWVTRPLLLQREQDSSTEPHGQQEVAVLQRKVQKGVAKRMNEGQQIDKQKMSIVSGEHGLDLPYQETSGLGTKGTDSNLNTFPHPLQDGFKFSQ